ncbi:MAG TPA: DNA polymerase/3'-5' exonuclease PolX [Candidatus Omnitrophica bacterium]|nr:DNA polymerase/3'-5' exonuclease PolX [Candidatus Omnitrophota bacterium]
MKNQLVADIFRGIAELLEIKGDNPFRIRAYLRAADTIEAFKDDVEDYSTGGRLQDIPGIGSDLAGKIKEIIDTGKCAHYDELKKAVPVGVVAMLDIPSVGPKTAKLFFDELHIKSQDELKEAAQAGRLLGLPGIKQKTVDNILKGIELLQKGKERMDLLAATAVAGPIISAIEGIKGVSAVSVAGSLRRMKESVRDIDILAASKDPKKVSDSFVGLPQVKRVLAEGETKSSILTKDDAQVDLRVVEPASYGAALLYSTGSKNHNIRLRSIAIKKGLKINEYGVFDKHGRRLVSKTEEDIYRCLGLDFIAPELREDAGEIEAAAAHRLPELIELGDIRGDLHAHTNYSDGKATIEAMAQEALRLGYGYICLTDHSESLKVANGLDLARLKEKRRELDRVNKKFKDLKLLFGSEVEIDSEGNIDYKDSILAGFDVVVAAIHSGFKQSKRQLTKRVIRACKNKFVHVIAHPTGKLWPTREAYDIDLKEVFKVARETNTALEINAHPYRLDLSDALSRQAKDNLVNLVINTDSHAAAHLSYMKFGVGLARRAWLEKGDVLNTLKLAQLLKRIKK